MTPITRALLLLTALSFDVACAKSAPSANTLASDAGPDIVERTNDTSPADSGSKVDMMGDGTSSTQDAVVADGDGGDSEALDTTPMATPPLDSGACSAAIDCDDGKPCTIDLCNPSDGTCSHKPHTGACDDGDLCSLAGPCGVDEKCVGDLPVYARHDVLVTDKVLGGHVATSNGMTALAGVANVAAHERW